MMEKGSIPVEFKGKALEEVDIDTEYAEENEDHGKQVN